MSSSLPDPPANARAWSTGRGPAGLHEPFAGPDRAGFAARCLQVVAELGVADRIDEAPVPVAVLASSCAVDIDALDRILRLLAVHGVFDRDADCYGHTPASRLLRSDCGRSSAHRTIGAGCPTPGLSAFGHVVINFRLRDPGAILIIGSIPRHTR